MKNQSTVVSSSSAYKRNQLKEPIITKQTTNNKMNINIIPEYQKEDLIPLEEPSENIKENIESPFIMTVEIEKGHSEFVTFNYDSIPEEVSFEFCKKHNLDFLANEYLVKEIKKILENQKGVEKNEGENMNINFSETIHEVEEEYMSSDLHRKDSNDRMKRIGESGAKEMLMLDRNNYCKTEEKENGNSKTSYSPFITETSSNAGENGLMSLLRKSVKGKTEREKKFEKKNSVDSARNKIEFKNKKSKSLTAFKKIRNKEKFSSQKTFRTENLRSSEDLSGVKTKFEQRCERISRLREIKAHFSSKTFTADFLSPPPMYDFSILKNRILSSSTAMFENSTNYLKRKEETVKKIKEKFDLSQNKFSFSPKINKNSEKIVTEKVCKSVESDVFSNLFELAKKRSERMTLLRNEYLSQYDYKPSLNSNNQINTTFEERQKIFSKRIEDKRKK